MALQEVLPAQGAPDRIDAYRSYTPITKVDQQRERRNEAAVLGQVADENGMLFTCLEKCLVFFPPLVEASESLIIESEKWDPLGVILVVLGP
jgi:hypothetical protein